MPCFFCPCNSGSSEDKKRRDAFEAAYDDDHNSISKSSRNVEHSRGYIPWVWRRKFRQAYQLGQILGEGSFAVVYDATTIEPPHESYAVKVIQRHRMSANDMIHFNDEVQILLDLQHDSIIQLHELYKTRDYFHVVMEKLKGGELFDRLCELEVYREMDARDICRTIFEAVGYCHDHHVAHRDLKPENLLLVSPDDSIKVKIADFGFAKKVPKLHSLTTRCGTPSYMAPEIVNAIPHDERVDNWSLGVILFTVLGGYNPFMEQTTHLTLQRVRQGYYQFDPEYWDGISTDAKKLIQGLLSRDPDKRTTAQEALNHSWITGRSDDLLKKNNHSLKKNRHKLKEFNAERKKRSANAKSVSFYFLLSRR
mmetsp:Transcript_19305/g.28563  ORF Transcript_19305/g.28563 Transcript_19305/m.28563 type:complete len:366 (+) Transcript_19305:86-1183(+)